MDMFKDYNAYLQYRPQYANWKTERQKQEAKRLAYLEKHPELRKDEDIQRGKTLLKAIDILDEYSQSSAENTELATEIVSQQVLGIISLAGNAVGYGAMYLKPFRKYFDKMAKTSKTLEMVASLVPMTVGGTIASLAAFPIMAWAAKTEVGASRKGRLEAMKTKLQNPANFAVLTDEQLKTAKELAAKIELTEEEKKTSTPQFSFKESVNIIKNFNKQEEIERRDHEEFKKLIQAEDSPLNRELSPEELEKAKRDQQILTKLVEKIDLASQDYAENVEFATNSLTILSPLFGAGVGWAASKINKLLKVNPDKIATKIAPWAVGLIGTIALVSYSTSIQKQASRVGRFNVRQELARNPEQLIYVDDEKVNAEISDDIEVKEAKRPNFFKFLWQVFKDNQAYKKYQKTEGLADKKLNKALEKIDLNDEQLAEAKVLQRNTFKTFNKLDEMSQKYSENVEAVGNALKQPIGLVCGTIGALVGFKYLNRIPDGLGSKSEGIKNIDAILKGAIKYVASVLISYLPLIAFDFYITKEQKSASRVADMQAINELDDIKNFTGYKANKPAERIDSRKFFG
ncbi:MAG: hypothetical protein NC390_04720 [Fusobacterium sp.]|nr:hypothetical protein [Fusobacterium sp.]